MSINPIPIENIYSAWKTTCAGCEKCKYKYEDSDSKHCTKCGEMIGRNVECQTK